MRYLFFSLLLLLTGLLPACAPAAGTPAPAQPTADPAYVSDGLGDPRTSRYWTQWSTCGEDSRAEIARANGGRAAGWILLDDLLEDPGIGLGTLPVETCAQATAFLRGQSLHGEDRTLDAAYTLGAQLLTAALNQAAGAGWCPAAQEAYQVGQDLLAEIGFDGQRTYLGPPRADEARQEALTLADALAEYNSGKLCR